MRKKDCLRRSFKGRPRRSLRCLGFLNGLCGVADHVQHNLWLGEHRDVTRAQLDGCGAHALCNESLQFGLDGAIFSGHDVPTWLRPPSDTVDLLVEQVGTGAAWVAHTSFCSASGKSPAKLPIPPGCFNQMRPSATSMWEKTSVAGNFCCKLCEVSVSSGARAAM